MALGAGTILGSYELVELLARGGMGEVYRARHRRLAGREVAIKVMPAALAADPSFRQRFEREANNIAGLSHPHILPLWDYGEQDGTHYIVMPLVAGGSLRDRLRGRHLTAQEVIALLRPIADALDYAHARGIVHRDIKPANVLLDERGQLYVADFGIAKATEEGGEALTRTGVGIGTPEYMAPEQAQGQAGPRSDIYALGIIAYEALAGRVPYSGKTPVDVAIQHVTAPLPPLAGAGAPTEAGRATASLDAVVRRALAKIPDDRFPTAGAFVAALAAAVANDRTVAVAPGDRPTVAAPPPPPFAAPSPPPPPFATPPPPPAPPLAQLPPVAAPPPPVAAPPRPAPRRGPIAALVGGLVIIALLAGTAAILISRRAPDQSAGGGATEPSATQAAGGSATATTAAGLPYNFPLTTADFVRYYDEARQRLPETYRAAARLQAFSAECLDVRATADCNLNYRFYSQANDTVYTYSFSALDTRPPDETSDQALAADQRVVLIRLPWEQNADWARLLRESARQLPADFGKESLRVELLADAAGLNSGSHDWLLQYLDPDASQYEFFAQRGTTVKWNK